MTLLAVEGVVAGYGIQDEVLKGIDFAVGTGEFVVIIGPNGAGKSTLIKLIAGMLSPRAGRVTLNGQPIGGLKPREVTRLGVAYVPQEANVFPSLTVEENLEMGGFVDRGRVPDRLRAVVARLPVLGRKRRSIAKTLSGGQRQVLAIGMALMVEPLLLLLDEPSAGLSPVAAADLFDLVKDLHSEGMTIAMVEQNALKALALADRGYLLVDGRNAREGDARELAADAGIRHAFLGG